MSMSATDVRYHEYECIDAELELLITHEYVLFIHSLGRVGRCGAATLSPVSVIGEVGVRVCVQPRRTRTPPPPTLCPGPLARAATGVAVRGRVATAVLALRSLV